MSEQSDDETKAFVLAVAGAWNAYYGTPLDSILTDAGIAGAQAMLADQTPNLSQPIFRQSPLDVPAWRALLARNTPRARRTPAPILMFVGTADNPSPQVKLAKHLRAIGDTLTLRVLKGANHAMTADRASQEWPRFLRERLHA